MFFLVRPEICHLFKPTDSFLTLFPYIVSQGPILQVFFIRQVNIDLRLQELDLNFHSLLGPKTMLNYKIVADLILKHPGRKIWDF